jgi:quinol monooxygenase YgiN
VGKLTREEGEKVTVIAVFRAIEGKEKDLEKELLALVPLTRREHSCINYDLHRSIEDPGVYVFHENWTSKKALDEHLEMPYLKELLKKSKELLEKPIELHICTRI